MSQIKKLLMALFACLLFAGCDDPLETPPVAERVLLVYLAADNNLSGYARSNIESLKEGMGAVSGNARTLVYVDLPDEDPTLREISASGETVLHTWEGGHDSASGETLQEVIGLVCKLAPADHYGLLLWSHGMGWVPSSAENYFVRSLSRGSDDVWPATKFFGQDTGVSPDSYMELDELAAAIPDHLFDYILFDACFMGSVEVLYALRDKADYIISSPAEVISDGFPYAQIMEPLCRENPDLETVCETYYRYYAEHDVPQYHAATVSLVKTSALETLASATAALYTAALSADFRIFSFMDSGQLQPLDRYARHFVFDMGSIADELYRQAVVSAEQYAEWQDAFSQAVIYEAHTPWFFSLQLDKCCGLSSYVPLAQYADLNAFYVQQEWYHRVFSE